ncbi:hypothetical protein CH302_01060 [Rhodococcus sp. 15-2388-1-1a]|uniref:hypothetical protein n=1 Tax=Nocardiaceae TaxID=85025 RepID=UPI00055D923B|nr:MULTISPECIES: hypothetical protein [Rhodococcus]OZF05243.1 hypothetical protein CH302_01060 [Rhodococcus sp. 15-2388-1-1a]
MPKFKSSIYPGLIVGRGETRTRFVDGEAEATGKAASFLRKLGDHAGVTEVSDDEDTAPAKDATPPGPDPVSPTAAGEPDPTSQNPPASPTAEGLHGDPASQKPPASPTAEGESAPKLPAKKAAPRTTTPKATDK